MKLKSTVLFTLLAMIFMHCSHENSVNPIPSASTWLKVYKTNQNSGILACYSSNDSVVFTGPSGLEIITANKPDSITTLSASQSTNNFAPLLNLSYGIYQNASTTTLKSFTLNNFKNSQLAEAMLSDVDSGFSEGYIKFVPSYIYQPSKWGCINSHDQMFFVVQNQVSLIDYLVLLNVSTAFSDVGFTPQHNIKKIVNPSYNGQIGFLYYLGNAGNNFICCFDRNYSVQHPNSFCIATIDTIGNCVFDTSDGFYPIASFKFENTYNLVDSTGKIYTSTTFSKWQANGNVPIVGNEYVQIDSLLCIRTSNKIYSWDNKSGILKELNNEGLQTETITGIAHCGEYVWIATFNGIFRKSLKDFFVSK